MFSPDITLVADWMLFIETLSAASEGRTSLVQGLCVSVDGVNEQRVTPVQFDGVFVVLEERGRRIQTWNPITCHPSKTKEIKALMKQRRVKFRKKETANHRQNSRDTPLLSIRLLIQHRRYRPRFASGLEKEKREYKHTHTHTHKKNTQKTNCFSLPHVRHMCGATTSLYSFNLVSSH